MLNLLNMLSKKHTIQYICSSGTKIVWSVHQSNFKILAMSCFRFAFSQSGMRLRERGSPIERKLNLTVNLYQTPLASVAKDLMTYGTISDLVVLDFTFQESDSYRGLVLRYA